MGKTIEKKILPEYYRQVLSHRKTFEIRKDDSDYEVGDVLLLKEWDGEKYTGNVVMRQITYILRDCPQYGLQPGYCILAVQPGMWESYRDVKVTLDTISITDAEYLDDGK